ncbi:MAG: CAT RNA binding domain-containing protein, partial [Collinsella sp.]|nr:CAT RNA binding domain-containing protein [Collinsella sp.]
MEIVKRINTSAVLCVDGNGRQLVAFGRGLGFKNVGDEVPLSEIQRTFYNVSSRYIALVDEVPDELLELTSDVIDMSTGLLPYEVSPNLPFILADHIAYAVKRKEQKIVVRMPLSFDVRQQYPVEWDCGGELGPKEFKEAIAWHTARSREGAPSRHSSGSTIAMLTQLPSWG